MNDEYLQEQIVQQIEVLVEELGGTLKQCLITSSLDDEEYVKETLIEATKIAKLELLKVDTHKFQPHGVTGYALLAESHMSIHTWPEDGIARCDLFSCNSNTDYKSVIEYMQTRFHSMEVKRWGCDRSDWL